MSKLEMLKTVIRSFGYEPERILIKEVLSTPHRTIIYPQGTELSILSETLKEIIQNEVKKTV